MEQIKHPSRRVPQCNGVNITNERLILLSSTLWHVSVTATGTIPTEMSHQRVVSWHAVPTVTAISQGQRSRDHGMQQWPIFSSQTATYSSLLTSVVSSALHSSISSRSLMISDMSFSNDELVSNAIYTYRHWHTASIPSALQMTHQLANASPCKQLTNNSCWICVNVLTTI